MPADGDCTDSMMSFIVAGYASAREELIERIKSRDSSVRLYLTIVSAIIGIILTLAPELSKSAVYMVALLSFIGILSVAMSQSVSNNQIKIATIGSFIDLELMPSLARVKSTIPPVDWESSETNKTTSRLPRKMHYAYYYMIFISPQVICILLCLYKFRIEGDATDQGNFILLIIYIIFSMLCLIATWFTLFVSNNIRESLNRNRKHS